MGNPAGQVKVRISKASATSRRRRARGFATIEVLVTMAIVLLVGTLAIVALTSNSARARLQDEVSAVALFLQQARLQATETGRNVEVVYDQQDGLIAAGTRSHEFGRGISSPTPSTALRIRPSGENEGLVLTLVSGDLSRIVEMDWLTGRVRLPQ